MAQLSDFLRLPKVDYLNNLQAGMLFKEFTRWAGFVVPGFPADEPCLDMALREDVSYFSRLKVTSRQDLKNLIYLSISQAASENVKVLNGYVDFDFCEKLKSPAGFIEMLNEIEEKYSNSIKIRPTLHINSNSDCNLFLAEAFAENKSIYGIYVTGSKFISEKTENYKEIFETGRKNGLRTLIQCMDFNDNGDLSFAVEKFCPEAIRDLSPLQLTDDMLKLLKGNDTTMVFSPELLNGNSREKIMLVRKLADNGLKIRLCSDSLLFYRKHLSEFAADICNTGLFTIEEAAEMISLK